MEDIFIITFRTIVLYFIILVIFRLMGKREIGELSILDLVVSIMIAEIAVLAIENVKDKLLHTIVPIVVLMIIQVSLAFISLKSQKIRQLLDGKPTIIIKQGKIDERAMRSQRYNFDDLLMQLRRITSIESLTCHMPFWSLQANCRSSKRKTIRISRWKHRLSLTGSFRTSIWTESGKINTGSKKI